MTSPELDEGRAERLTFKGILELVLHGWRVIATFTCLCVLISLFVSARSQEQYRAYYIAIPASANSDALRSTSLPLSLLGGASRSPDWDMYQSLLTSTTLAQRLATKTNLLKELFAGRWDAGRQSWKPSPSFWQLSLGGKFNALFVPRYKGVPDKYALQGYLRAALSIQAVPESSTIMVSIDSPDPDISLKLLRAVHENSNDIVREERLTRALGQREHLLGELRTTSVADYTAMLQQLLSRVESDIMTASFRSQYAAVIVDGPASPPDPVFPRPFLFLQLALIGGVVLGLILVIFTPITDALLVMWWQKIRRKPVEMFQNWRLPSAVFIRRR